MLNTDTGNSDITNNIEEILHDELRQTRKIIESKMNQLLQMQRKEEVVKIDEQFEIRVLDAITKRGNIKTGGKNVLLSLVYVSALLDFCKEREKDQKKYLINGTAAPLILDSPFSVVDDFNDKLITKFLPKCAEQVILLLNHKMYDSIRDEFDDVFGESYIVTFNSIKKSNNTIKDEVVNISNSEYTLTKYDQDKNYSQIHPVNL